MASDFYLRYYVGHKGKFGHEFLEFEFRPDGEGWGGTGSTGWAGGTRSLCCREDAEPGRGPPRSGARRALPWRGFNVCPVSAREAALRQQQQLQERRHDPKGGKGELAAAGPLPGWRWRCAALPARAWSGCCVGNRESRALVWWFVQVEQPRQRARWRWGFFFHGGLLFVGLRA